MEPKIQNGDLVLIKQQASYNVNDYVFVIHNDLPKLKKITPGLKSPTVAPLAKEGWISVQTVIKEDIFWETIERLKQAGASGILVLPIEKIII